MLAPIGSHFLTTSPQGRSAHQNKAIDQLVPPLCFDKPEAGLAMMAGRSRSAERGGSSSGKGAPSRDSRIEKLMESQLALLVQEREQRLYDKHMEEQRYVPKEVYVKRIDPGLRKIVQDFEKEAKKKLEQLHDQKRLKTKYEQQAADDVLSPHLQKEAEHKIQLLKGYVLQAKPVNCEKDDDMGDDYNVEAAWKELRKRHALECQEFIWQHQARQLEWITRECQADALGLNLKDKLEAEMDKLGYSMQTIRAVQLENTKQFVLSLLRAEVPMIEGRLAKKRREGECKEERAARSHSQVGGDASRTRARFRTGRVRQQTAITIYRQLRPQGRSEFLDPG